MAQEFTIKSDQIENKINQLLPSQGGFGAGVDFSASTMVIPIVDLTETAEGSSLRQDLQTSLSLANATAFDVSNTNSTIINTTGFFRIFGNYSMIQGSAGSQTVQKFELTDGFTTKIINSIIHFGSSQATTTITPFDFIVKIEAGNSCVVTSTTILSRITGCTRQIADIDGNLT